MNDKSSPENYRGQANANKYKKYLNPPHRFVQKLPLHENQQLIWNVYFSGKYRALVINAGRRFGKALNICSIIPTPNGWTELKNIHPGDTIFGDDGKPTKVLWESEIITDNVQYEITFSDGAKVQAGAEHLWTVWDIPYRAAIKKKKSKHAPKTLTTQQMLDFGLIQTTSSGTRKQYNFAIPVTKPIQYEEKKFIIPPYVMGAWLGDGCKSSGVFTQHIDDVQVIDEIRSYGYTVRKNKAEHCWGISGLTRQLREVGVYNNKHIPVNYLQGSVQQRLELLQGLMDTDGSISDKGMVEFGNTNRNIAHGVYELVCSLGIKATITESDAKLYGKVISRQWRVHFSTTMPVFRLKRKAAKIAKTLKARVGYRTIREITKIDSVPMKCIAVDNASHLFLVGKEALPTHNSTVCMAIAIELAVNYGKRVWWVGRLTGTPGNSGGTPNSCLTMSIQTNLSKIDAWSFTTTYLMGRS